MAYEQSFDDKHIVSGPIKKKSSVSDDSSSDVMELDETAMADQHIELNLRRLREEERMLLERQAAMEAGGADDFTVLHNQDALRLNHLRQHELQRQLAVIAARAARRQRALEAQRLERAEATRPRAQCNVRVNHLHAVEAIETDV